MILYSVDGYSIAFSVDVYSIAFSVFVLCVGQTIRSGPLCYWTTTNNNCQCLFLIKTLTQTDVYRLFPRYR